MPTSLTVRMIKSILCLRQSCFCYLGNRFILLEEANHCPHKILCREFHLTTIRFLVKRISALNRHFFKNLSMRMESRQDSRYRGTKCWREELYVVVLAFLSGFRCTHTHTRMSACKKTCHQAMKHKNITFISTKAKKNKPILMVFLFSFSLSCSLWLSELLSLPSYLSAHNQSAHFFYRQTSYARKK